VERAQETLSAPLRSLEFIPKPKGSFGRVLKRGQAVDV